MDNNVKSRLIRYIKSKKMTQKEFISSIQLSNGYINSIRKSISPEVLSRIQSKYPDLNRDWLLYGEGEMTVGDEAAPATPVGVPYYDADFECGFTEFAPLEIQPDAYINLPGYEKTTFWCNAIGQSMQPIIDGGDYIALQEIHDPTLILYGEIYAIVTYEGLRTVKRIRRSPNPKCFRLIPENPNYDSQDIEKRQIRAIFRVLGVVKRF